MTDATNDAAVPPKRRAFGFKKAAWQTAPKKDEQDMFSHSNEFQDVVAEQAKRHEQKKQAEEAQKRKAEEERHRKRRKVSVESDEGERTRSSPRGQRVTIKGRSKTPMSPTRNNLTSETLATRYDSLTKPSSSSAGVTTRSQVIDLGDTEDEDDSPRNPSPSPRAIPIHSRQESEGESSEEVEEVDSPHIAALKAQIRARASAKSPDTDQAPAVSSSTPAPAPVAIVQLLIESDIPHTKPLVVKIKTDASLAKPKEAWCARQGFTPTQTRDIFMTWKDRRIFDYTKIQRLGIRLDNGFVSVEGDPTIYDDENLPRIHIEAWTEEVYRAKKDADALEAAAAAKAAQVIEEPEPGPEPEPEVKQIKLVLKAKGKEDFKLKVNPHTEIGHIASAYKFAMEIPKEQPITLMFDGDRLKPMDTVADIDVDDMDAIEVHFK